jgi:hypothetical protein
VGELCTLREPKVLVNYFGLFYKSKSLLKGKSRTKSPIFTGSVFKSPPYFGIHSPSSINCIGSYSLLSYSLLSAFEITSDRFSTVISSGYVAALFCITAVFIKCFQNSSNACGFSKYVRQNGLLCGSSAL